METSFKQTTSNKVERYRLFLPQFEPVSYTHLTLPTICSV